MTTARSRRMVGAATRTAATATATRQILLSLCALTTMGAVIAGCTETERPQSAWHLADFRVVSPETPCCRPALAAILGLMAARDLAMPQNSLKIASGCSEDGAPSIAAVMTELKLLNNSNVFEYFEGASQIEFDGCDDAAEAEIAAVFQAVSRAVSTWKVQTFSDDEICELLKNAAIEASAVQKPLLMAGFDQVVDREIRSCSGYVAALARSGDQQIALRAVGALGIVGSVADFEVLGRLTLSDMPQMPWAATHAIADIGGPTAARALEIVAGQAKTAELRREAFNLAEKVRSRR